MKYIYLEPNEEIVSVIDRLIQVQTKQINLIIPTGAQIWQSSINLKLLKREADLLNKQLTLIVADDLGAEIAEKIGFLVRKERDLPVELIQEESQPADEEITKPSELEEPEVELASIPKSSKENMIDLLVEELESDEGRPRKTSPFLSWKKKPKKEVSLAAQKGVSPKKMIDIVNPQAGPQPRFFRRKKTPIQSFQSGPLIEEKSFTKTIVRPITTKWSKLLVVFVAAAIVITGIIAYLVLPTTEVIISPKKEKVGFDLEVVGSKGTTQVNQSLNEIPLQEIEVRKTKSQTFKATGEKEISEKASGNITIYNEYSSSPQTLVATTRFESSDGKVFRIPNGITVPGAEIEEGKIIASTIKVKVVADQPGPDYNIGPSEFTIPGFKGTAKFAAFYAKSDEAMSGGAIGKVKVVLDEDLEKAEESLTSSLKDEVGRTLDEQIPEDWQIVKNGRKEETVKISSNVDSGDQTEQFLSEIDYSIKALLFKEEDLKTLVDLNLKAQIPEDREPLKASQQIIYSDPIIDWSKKQVSFSLEVEEEVARKIDIESLKEELAGMNEVEVRKYLANQPEIERARVSFWPFWVKKIPSQTKKIQITIEN
ncbi:MAG: hypothetical protein ABIF84_00190 [Patescibacteria group bacterium]